MKIDGTVQFTGSVQTKSIKTVKGRKIVSGGALQGDNVEITAASSRLSELEAQLAELPAEDAAKVAAIRQAIADGTFKVDEEAVAEGLVKETVEQLQQRR